MPSCHLLLYLQGVLPCTWERPARLHQTSVGLVYELEWPLHRPWSHRRGREGDPSTAAPLQKIGQWGKGTFTRSW